MWIINHITSDKDRNGNPRRGWHCILMNEGYSEWVDGGLGGSYPLTRWKDDSGTLALSHDFYEAASYTVPVSQYKLIKQQADRHDWEPRNV